MVEKRWFNLLKQKINSQKTNQEIILVMIKSTETIYEGSKKLL